MVVQVSAQVFVIGQPLPPCPLAGSIGAWIRRDAVDAAGAEFGLRPDECGDFTAWRGEPGRPLQFMRPCSCGCDAREGKRCVGYITGSDADGLGFSLWVKRFPEVVR